MELFKGITIFVGWLTGSLAGIGAVFYTSGYLAARAHLNLLGLSGIINYGNEHYIQEGAKFFLGVAQIIAGISLALFAVLGLSVSALLIILSLFFRDRTRLREFLNDLKERLLRIYRSDTCHLVLYGLLLMALIVHSGSYLEKFGQALSISNLLYESADGAPMTNAYEDLNKIKGWLLKNDDAHAKSYFEFLLWGELAAIGLLFVACEVCAGFRWRMLWLAPFFLSSTIFTLSLPMAYGTLLRPTKYPSIIVTSKNKLLKGDEKLFLLNKTEREFIVWDARRRRVLWIPADSIEHAEVSRVTALFDTKEAK